MCDLCCTYIKLNDYWIQKFGLDVNKNNYISITSFSELIWNTQFTVKHMNTTIQELNLDKEGVKLIDDKIDTILTKHGNK